MKHRISTPNERVSCTFLQRWLPPIQSVVLTADAVSGVSRTACKVEFQPFNRSYSQVTFFIHDSLQSWVSTISSVVLTTDVFIFLGKISTAVQPAEVAAQHTDDAADVAKCARTRKNAQKRSDCLFFRKKYEVYNNMLFSGFGETYPQKLSCTPYNGLGWV